MNRFLSIAARGCSNQLMKVGVAFKGTKFGSMRVGRWIIDGMLFPHDWVTIQDHYQRIFGRTPRLLKPVTFNEWIQHHKLFRRRSRYQVWADKLAVRDWVGERLGRDVLNEVLWVGRDLAEAPKESLPPRFVVKTNHACHTNIIVADAAELDWSSATVRVREWLRQDYSLIWGEWEYRWIPPRVFIEAYLEGPEGKIPYDYKLFCFHGRVEFVELDIDRFGDHRRAMLNREGVLQPFTWRVPRHEDPIQLPSFWIKMIEMAECLAQGEAFLRVDFYDAGRPVFSELTLHPTSGFGQFIPAEYDEIIGRLLLKPPTCRKQKRKAAVLP